jgi:mannose-6-phosphate isomerase
VDDETLEVFNKHVLCPTDTDPSHWFVKTEPFNRGTKTVRYVTPFHEFDILWTRLQAGEAETHQGISGPSVAVVSSGSGTVSSGDVTLELQEGQVFLVLADQKLDMRAAAGGMQVYRCFTE